LGGRHTQGALSPEAAWPRGERIERAQLAVVLALVAVAALGWVVARDRMVGMDMGPGTDLGSLGFYVPIWVAMMAAMMLPSAAPMVAVHFAVERRRRWTAFGVVAYALFELVRSFDIDVLVWSRGGRYVAALVVAAAAVYQLTPLKDACLAKCRSPFAFVVDSWRAGRLGALRMGIEHGAWCVGCCWALMATLFALGVMSIVWTVVIAALVALEKLSPWEGASRGVALVLLALALAIALAPEHVPALTIPGS
jgi:predicted metal-binding membrane protein